ncbi:hypothetical protein TNCV_4605311 [Trichonephila clavipes]|nr:hypothetical protein TNCV_4605311 [Trichonephila clavipes]
MNECASRDLVKYANKPVLLADNQAAIDFLKSPIENYHTKHIEKRARRVFSRCQTRKFSPLPSQKPPDPPDSNMDTETTPTTDSEKCEKMSLLEEETKYVLDRLNFLELTLARMKSGKSRKTKEDFERILKDKEQQRNLVEHKKGELLSLGSCPIPDCQFHSNLNAVQIVRQNEEEVLKLQLFLASNISNLKNNVNDKNAPKADEIKNKKTNRVEGFTSPIKVAKKQKILQNYSIGVDAPVNVQNKFNALAGSSAMPDSVNAAVPVAPKTPQDSFYPP